ncbi:DNA polymerase alpha accessory factor Mcl1 [Malassezia sp. CBS 17886]|nr:DNA polymerase alpha accessory factor Mcl1 [Malassezia sp. CBS 17886]
MGSLPGDELPVQVTHTPGVTRVSYVSLDDGGWCVVRGAALTSSRLVTAGEDHLVRLLPGEATSDVSPLVIEDASRPMTWVDADAAYLVTASEDGVARLYRHIGDGARDATTMVHIVRREVLPIRCVALERHSRGVANGGPRVAICSDELIVRVVDAADPRSITVLPGHSRGVRAASWSPVLTLLLTCGSDGDIRAWDMAQPGHPCVRTLDNILPALRPESEFSSLACWHPSGTYFAVPTKARDVALVHAPSRGAELLLADRWYTGAVLDGARGTGASARAPCGLVSSLAFSPSGRYLAVGTEDMQVSVWAMDSRTIVRAQQAEGIVTGLAWHPHKDALAWTDAQGQLTRWSPVVGATMPSPWEPDTAAEHRARDSGLPSLEAALGDDLGDLFDDTGIDEVESAAEDTDTRQARLPRRRGPNAAPTLRQPALQPGATPMAAQRRYLGVSVLGTLTAVDQDMHQMIVFDSYDTSQRRNFRFTDHYGYRMAAMAPQGILFACAAEAESPCTVMFRPFDDQPGIQAEWSVHLPRGEDTTAVALGGIPNMGSHADVHLDGAAVPDEGRTSAATAVVATTRGYLRFFGASGMQRYVWALGLPVVMMAAGRTLVLVVYRAANESAGHVHLEYLLVELGELAVLQRGCVPLPHDATLQWAGFTETDSPALFDSRGTLYALDRAWRPMQARWTPALDTAAALAPPGGDADAGAAARVHCWPVGVTTTHLLALLLPASTRYPNAGAQRPLLQELELNTCVAQRESNAAPLEEAALRRSLQAHAARDARAATGRIDVDAAALELEADKALLQLVQLACKADKYARALDAARLLHSEATLDAALKIAHFFHLPSLADRMEQLRAPLAVRKQLQDELTERACGTNALLRNTATVTVPGAAPPPPPADSDAHHGARAALAQAGFEPSSHRGVRAGLQGSLLAREGLAYQQGGLAEHATYDSASLHSTPPSMPSIPSIPSMPSAPSSRPAPPTSQAESALVDSDGWPRQGAAPCDAASTPGASSDATQPTPSAPMSRPPVAARANPFARTHSAVKDREHQKSQSFFDRVESAAKRHRDTPDDDALPEKRASSSTRLSRQSTLASFAYAPPASEEASPPNPQLSSSADRTREESGGE